MTRIYIALGVIAILASGVVYVRLDAAADERARIASERAKQEAKTLKEIHRATTDVRSSDDVRERLRRLAE